MFETLAQKLRIKSEPFSQRLNQQRAIDVLRVFARENHSVDCPRINQHLLVAIEDAAARRRNRQQANALVLGDLGIARAVNYLQHVKAHRQNAQQDQRQHLHYAQPQPQVL